MKDLDTLIEKGQRLMTRNQSLSIGDSELGQIWFFSRSQVKHSQDRQSQYSQYDDQNIGYGLESSLNAYLIGLIRGYRFGLTRRKELDRKGKR